MADKTAPEPAFAVMLRPERERPLSIGDHVLTPGQQLALQDGQLVDALLTHQNSLIPIRDGVEVPRNDAIAFLTERLKRTTEQAAKPRVPVHHGIVDPATDEGEKGPGLTAAEMVALPAAALEIPPLTETTNKTELQAYIDKFKLGRPPLRATIADIHASLLHYLQLIRETRHAEKQRAHDHNTRALEFEAAHIIVPPLPEAPPAPPPAQLEPVAELAPTPEQPAAPAAEESAETGETPPPADPSADRPGRAGRSRHR